MFSFAQTVKIMPVLNQSQSARRLVMNQRLRLLGISIVVLAGCRSVVPEPPVKQIWDFEAYQGGTRPAEWLPAETASRQTPGTWLVAGDAWGKAIALMQSPNTGDTYNLLLASNTRLGNVKYSAKIKTISGYEDHGGGVLWRALDGDNYYVANWEPLQSKLSLYVVVSGSRTELRAATVHGDLATWHTIAIEHFRENITIAFDGQQVITLQDDTLRMPGMIGLWTRADACAMYDDIVVEEIK
jgi:hypothetical protein